MKIIHQETPKSFAGRERGDCGVFALSAILCISYEEAHTLLAKAGRTPRAGTYGYTMEKAIVLGGYDFTVRQIRADGYTTTGRRKRVTCRNVLDHVPPRGHFLIGSTHHWFAVVDGVIYDNGGMGKNDRLQSYREVHVS